MPVKKILLQKPKCLTDNLLSVFNKKPQSVCTTKPTLDTKKRKIQIFFPQLVEGSFDAPHLVVVGLRGTLTCQIPSKFEGHFVLQDKNTNFFCFELTLNNIKDLVEFNNLSGNIYGRLVGVSCGYKKKLKIRGVGYKTFLEKNNTLKFILGYSHDVYFHIGPTITSKFGRKNNRLVLTGASLPQISGITAALHAFKKPDVYKGKGVRLKGIKLRKKEGKKKK